MLQISIQEILKASVMAGVDVLSAPLTSLLDAAKNLSSFLPVLVPGGLYLPSPPLYCPQPSPNTQVRLRRKRPLLLYAHDIPAGCQSHCGVRDLVSRIRRAQRESLRKLRHATKCLPFSSGYSCC